MKASELILNADGSIYHLALKPQDLAPTVITVGDPERVTGVSKYFDRIVVKKEKREFHTHTGYYKGKRITVISTGIGTDNIDIVFNELDALVNIDLEDRKISTPLKKLNIIRIGTSGSLRKEIETDSFLLSQYAIGFDNLAHFYRGASVVHPELSEALSAHLQRDTAHSQPYVVQADADLVAIFSGEDIRSGVTATNSGFYGPQGRQLRVPVKDPDFLDKLVDFQFNELQVTNLEMETSGIYFLSKMMGHSAISLNCILANRASGTFSSRGGERIDDLIRLTLEKIASSNYFPK
nr:nucleoside phosphorylase [Robertkochia marina]